MPLLDRWTSRNVFLRLTLTLGFSIALVGSQVWNSTFYFDWLRRQVLIFSGLDNFLSTNEDIQEEEESEFDGRDRRDSENYKLPELNDVDKAKLMSCIEEIRNIVGESCSDKRIVDAVMKNDYDFTKALDMVLSTDTTTTTQLSKKPKVTEVEKGKKNQKNLSTGKFLKLRNLLLIKAEKSRLTFPFYSLSLNSCYH